MKKLSEIKFHGLLGEQMQRSVFNLDIKSVAEGIHAINCLTQGKFYRQLRENDKKNIKYHVLVNGRDFVHATEEITVSDILASELAMENSNLKTIDFIPVIEGSGGDVLSALTIATGVILIALGAAFLVTGFAAPYGVPLIIAGLGLVAAGVINLLSSPPKFDDFRQIERGGKTSYLFNGPENITREGGPVFIGYGRLIIGSHVIQSSETISDQDATATLTV